MSNVIEFTVEEALAVADTNNDAYRHVASVTRTLAAEVRRLRAAPTLDRVRDDARIDGTIRVGDAFPKLFVTTPDGVRKEIKRIEYVDPKFPTWNAALTPKD